jgi:hypothetical protein
MSHTHASPPGCEATLENSRSRTGSDSALNIAAIRTASASESSAEVNGGQHGTTSNALQDKVWVHGPGKEPWEVYVVKADADTLGKSAGARGEADTCCD